MGQTGMINLRALTLKNIQLQSSRGTLMQGNQTAAYLTIFPTAPASRSPLDQKPSI